MVPGILRVITVNAHFDGKADEPLDLPPNQALILQIQTVSGGGWIGWIAANALDSDALPVDLTDQRDHYLYGGVG